MKQVKRATASTSSALTDTAHHNRSPLQEKDIRANVELQSAIVGQEAAIAASRTPHLQLPASHIQPEAPSGHSQEWRHGPSSMHFAACVPVCEAHSSICDSTGAERDASAQGLSRRDSGAFSTAASINSSSGLPNEQQPPGRPARPPLKQVTQQCRQNDHALHCTARCITRTYHAIFNTHCNRINEAC